MQEHMRVHAHGIHTIHKLEHIHMQRMHTHTIHKRTRTHTHIRLGPCHGNSRIPENPWSDWLPFRWCHAIDNRTGRWRAHEHPRTLCILVFLVTGATLRSVRPFPRWRSVRDIYRRRSVRCSEHFLFYLPYNLCIVNIFFRCLTFIARVNYIIPTFVGFTVNTSAVDPLSLFIQYNIYYLSFTIIVLHVNTI
jgi:hypothetical protein